MNTFFKLFLKEKHIKAGYLKVKLHENQQKATLGQKFISSPKISVILLAHIN
jgi:hypothetical protein